MRAVTLLCGLFVLAPAANAVGQNRDQTLVTVIDVDGNRHTGTLLKLADEKLVLRGQAVATFETSNLLRVEWEGRRVSEVLGSSVVYFANGDRMLVNPVSMNDEHLSARWLPSRDRLPVRIPLETMRGIVFAAPKTNEARTRLTALLLDRRDESDLLVLANDDRLAGEIQSLDGESIWLEGPAGKIQIDRSHVRAVGFNPALISFPPANGMGAIVTLNDGSRISARNIRLVEEDRLEAELLFGEKIQIRIASLVSLQFFGGAAVFLSDLEPSEYRFTPFLSTRWPWRRNLSVSGGPLRLRGTEYARGIGLHSKSRLTYRLEGRYRRFQADVGIDDVAGGAGNVVFAVEVDGKRVFTSKPQRGNSPVLRIGPIDVRGKQQLSLVVDYGQFGDIRDHADWCDALLLRRLGR